MTKEEAIEELKWNEYFESNPEKKEAQSMAIKSLEQEPCEDCEDCKHNDGECCRLLYEESELPIADVVEISKGATNGDMIKAMLNPYNICEYKYSVHVYMTEKDFWNGNYQMNLDSDWWNSLYKKGVEE